MQKYGKRVVLDDKIRHEILEHYVSQFPDRESAAESLDISVHTLSNEYLRGRSKTLPKEVVVEIIQETGYSLEDVVEEELSFGELTTRPLKEWAEENPELAKQEQREASRKGVEALKEKHAGDPSGITREARKALRRKRQSDPDFEERRMETYRRRYGNYYFQKLSQQGIEALKKEYGEDVFSHMATMKALKHDYGEEHGEVLAFYRELAKKNLVTNSIKQELRTMGKNLVELEPSLLEWFGSKIKHGETLERIISEGNPAINVLFSYIPSTMLQSLMPGYLEEMFRKEDGNGKSFIGRIISPMLLEIPDTEGNIIGSDGKGGLTGLLEYDDFIKTFLKRMEGKDETCPGLGQDMVFRAFPIEYNGSMVMAQQIRGTDYKMRTIIYGFETMPDYLDNGKKKTKVWPLRMKDREAIKEAVKREIGPSVGKLEIK